MTETKARLVVEADARQVRSASDELDRMSRISRDTERETSRFAATTSSAFAGLKANIVSLVAAYASLESVKSIASASLDVQRFSNSLQVGLGSVQEAGKAMEFLKQSSKTLGLDLRTSADQFSKLAAAAKGTALEGQATRDIFLGISKAAVALGLSADHAGGALLAIQQMVSKGKVSLEELSGQLGERLPGALQIAARSMGMTTQELGKLVSTGNLTADELLPKLAAELEKTFGTQAQSAAEGLQAQINRFNTALFEMQVAIGNTGLIDFLSDGIKLATRLANAMSSVFGGAEQLSAIDQQKARIAGLRKELESMNDRKNIPAIGELLFDKVSADLLEQRIEDAVADLGKMEAAALGVAKAQKEINKPTASVSSASSSATKKELADTQRLIKLNDRRLEQLQDEGRRLTESLDPLVKRNNEMAKYQSLLEAGAIDGGIFNSAAQQSTENYLRALGFVEMETEDVIDKTYQLGSRTREVFDSMEQIAIQGVRNIQSAFADGIFNFFDRGLKGMVSSVITAVGRIAAEFASIKILQGAGGLLGLGAAGGAFASSGGGVGSALNLASLGSSAANLFTSGFGATNLVGGGLSALGGASSLGAFGAGLQGGSAGATFIAAESAAAGAGSAAGLGSAIGAAAGPLIALAVVDQVGRIIAGNKTTGTFVDSIPVIGGFASALFGRGPLKQKETSLSGTIGTEGFESGGVQTNFKAKGGLFRSNKNDFARVDAVTGEVSTDNSKLNEYANELAKVSKQVISNINDTVSAVGDSLNSIGDGLGISTDALNAFQTQINLVSESGEFLEDAQIAEEIARISNAMAISLMPNVEDFSMAGESAVGTLQRIGTEFGLLVNSATILGLSLAESREMIQGVAIPDRTAFIDAAGGLEALSQQAGFFADNFLTDAERLAPSIETLNKEMEALGFSANITKEQFKDLVQSFGQAGGISEDAFRSLLKIAPLFVRVKDGVDGLNGALTDTLDLTERISSARNALITVYNRERSALQDTASKFRELSFTLRDASDSLSLGALSPLTPGQKLDEARTQFNQDRLAANQGDQEALRRLPESGKAFLEASRVFNASSTEFTSDFRFVQGVLESAANLANVEAGVAEQQLAMLEDQINRLIEIDESVKTVTDAVRELTEAVLQGGGNAGISDQAIRDFVSTPGTTNKDIQDAAVKYGISDDQYSKATGAKLSDISAATGGASISDAQIKDFFQANLSNPRLIYDTAKSYGLTMQRVASASGYAFDDIKQWAAQNKLPMFEKGTDFVQKGGVAMLHPAEAVTPANHMRDMAKEISDLRKELSELRKEQNQQTQALINVNMESNKLNANMIIASNKDAQKSAAWRDNNRVNVR